MSSFLSEVGGITAGVGAEGLAFAAGFAAAHALQPEADAIAQAAWHAAQIRRLDPNAAAEAAAEALADEGTMATEASYSGLDATRFAYLYDLALTAPGTGELLNMLRRNDEVAIDFTHGLRKGKLETQWDAALANLRDVRIPAPDLAYMVVRDLVPDPFGVSGPTSADDTSIIDIPQLDIDTLAEAAKTGWDAKRFEALVGRSGLAPAPIFAANAFFRNIIDYPQFKTIIAKGDLRPAYTNVILNASRQILTAGEYSEAQLRGYSTATERLANTAKHGMSAADSDLLHLIQGRPIAVHQVTTGLARGGKYGGLYTDVPEPYQDAIRQSNIKEPWAGLDYANRYSYPSAFVIRALATAGELAPGDVNGVLLAIGWPPDLAVKVVRTWTGAKLTGATPQTVAEAVDAWGGAAAQTAAIDANVKKAHTKAWTEAQASYIAEESTAADVQPIFTVLGIDATASQQILSVWDEIRALTRKQLSPKEIVKAVQGRVINPATGVAWTTADGLAALTARGYDAADAAVLLAE